MWNGHTQSGIVILVMKKYQHPGLVNSSLVVFTLLAAPLISYGMAGVFSEWNRLLAATCIYVCSLSFMVVWFMLKQFEDADYLLGYYTIAFLVFPLIAGLILNMLFGTLHNGEVPIIAGVGFIGRYTMLVKAYPSVLLQYGAFTLAASVCMGLFFEVCYTYFNKAVPSGVPRKFLLKIDKTLDQRSMRLSDRVFIKPNKGLFVGLTLLLVQIIAMTLVLVIGTK